MGEQAEACDGDDADLDELDAAGEKSLVVLVGKLAGGRREDEKGNDQKPGGKRVDERGINAERRPQIIDDEQRQREAEGVVIEGADRLGHEEGPEPVGPEQRELALAAHLW